MKAKVIVALCALVLMVGCGAPEKKGKIDVVQAPSMSGVIYPVAKAKGGADRIIINGREVLKHGAAPGAPISHAIVNDAIYIRDNLNQAEVRSDKVDEGQGKLAEANALLTNKNSELAQEVGALKGEVDILKGKIFLHWIGHAVAAVVILVLVVIIIRTGSITRLFG